ncbi:JmjC domain-containing protein [Streptomyces niveus]|uniref:JmjC domain-containing protein n=1 Tax=Streptomyces niveus TaxID=193462 RepID=UPI003683083C
MNEPTPVHIPTQHEMASTIYTRLCSAVEPRRLPGSGMELAYFPQAFNEQWITSLPLPVDDRDPGQTVALVDEDAFQRQVSEKAIAAAYSQRPRTRVFESIHARSDGWFSLVALWLTGQLRNPVICTMYESDAGDLNLGAHDDEWDGVIVQMRGSKLWRLWPEPQSHQRELVTRAGDVLLLPRGVRHAVQTPDYSVHMVLAVTDEPLAAFASQPLARPVAGGRGDTARAGAISSRKPVTQF